jgi:hypothetical protein
VERCLVSLLILVSYCEYIPSCTITNIPFYYYTLTQIQWRQRKWLSWFIGAWDKYERGFFQNQLSLTFLWRLRFSQREKKIKKQNRSSYHSPGFSLLAGECVHSCEKGNLPSWPLGVVGVGGVRYTYHLSGVDCTPCTKIPPFEVLWRPRGQPKNGENRINIQRESFTLSWNSGPLTIRYLFWIFLKSSGMHFKNPWRKYGIVN